MKQDAKERRIRRGYAILAALFLASLLVFNVDAVAGWFEDHIEVVAIVPSTNGVRVGASVLVQGVEAGRVTAIRFVERDGQGAVAMDLRLDGRVRPVLRHGSRAFTAKERFIGEPTVRITAGPASAPALEPGDTIAPSERPTITALMEQGKAFPAALDSLGQGMARLQALVEARRPALAPLTERLAAATREAGLLQDRLDGGSLGAWLEDPSFDGGIQRLQARLAELEQATDQLARYGGDAGLGREAAALGERARRLGQTLDGFQERMDTGTLGRLQRDSALTVAIRGVTAQVDSLRAAGMDFALKMILP